MPLFFILNLYVSCALYHIYCHKKEVINEIQDEIRRLKFRNACRKITAAIWYYTAKVWNGYEIIYHPEAKKYLNRGNEESEIPVMVIYYHGALPIDLYYFIMNHALDSNKRQIHPCVDRFMFKVPGFSQALKFWNCIPGPRDKIIESLVNNNVVALSPGGTREAVFSRNYQLIWENSKSNKRLGFAECILQAKKLSPSKKVAVIPMFTKNCRAMFDYPNFVKVGWFGGFVRNYLYEKLRWPLYPLYGGFPIKMTSFLGDPLVLEEGGKEMNAIELSAEIKGRLKRLIRNNQDVESSTRYENSTYLRTIITGIIQRFQIAKANFTNDITVRVQDLKEQATVKVQDLREQVNKQMGEISERIYSGSRRGSQNEDHLHND